MGVTNSSDLFGNKILVSFKDLNLSEFQSNVRFSQEIRPMLQSYQHLEFAVKGDRLTASKLEVWGSIL